ncbi:hypothetical protein PFICI_03902 [Pestalotiopsis fici W106-1]|uniref:Uncharacterized protein n=1 Tax=Pestalotiopsis fici (strain W106-1 / CGMCC3.15140) TaxID=1229662 RepID=W3XK87_PESFW|nr:uncharacterized protein PFICI_03902 [Pestalotiopsis fici W106-1]ETS85877.1 hypothetical protein PFICI_03902 [Pestalotiopsis fici W106-1]
MTSLLVSPAQVAVATTYNTDEVWTDSPTEHEQIDYKLRRKLRSKQEKLRAAKLELEVEKEEYHKVIDCYNAALDQPEITEQELDELWKPAEMKRRHVQAFKMFLRMAEDKAEKADAALRSFEAQTIESKMRRDQASTYFPFVLIFLDEVDSPLFNL